DAQPFFWVQRDRIHECLDAVPGNIGLSPAERIRISRLVGAGAAYRRADFSGPHGPSGAHSRGQWLRATITANGCVSKPNLEVRMSSLNRREFLKTTITDGAVAGALPLSAERRTATDIVTLGNSGMKVTRLAFGTGSNNGHVQAA